VEISHGAHYNRPIEWGFPQFHFDGVGGMNGSILVDMPTEKSAVRHRYNKHPGGTAILLNSYNSLTIANSSAKTLFLPTSMDGTKALPGGILIPGRQLRLRCGGFLSTLGVSPGNITIDVAIGSTQIFTATSAAPLSLSNQGWFLFFDLSCYTGGATGTLQCAGTFMISGTTATVMGIVTTSPVTVNLTLGANFIPEWTWSVADPANTMTLTTACLEIINL